MCVCVWIDFCAPNLNPEPNSNCKPMDARVRGYIGVYSTIICEHSFKHDPFCMCSFVLCDANDDLVSVDWLFNQLVTEEAKAAIAR